METIMHTLDDDSSDEAEAPRPDAAQRNRRGQGSRGRNAPATAAAPPLAPPVPAGATPFSGRTPYTGTITPAAPGKPYVPEPGHMGFGWVIQLYASSLPTIFSISPPILLRRW